MKTETKLKKWTLSKWKKELDTTYSIFIRRSFSKNGKVACYTCGVEKPITEMHCGHFNPRQYLDTRWDERNTKPQCPTCNTFNNGQPTIFAEKLVKEYGEDILTELSKNNFTPVRLDKFWYADKVEEYKKKINEL